MDFQKSKTKENLARSFAAESQEGLRYQILAQMAQTQGYQYMSALIRTLAHNEVAHAKLFFQKINDLGDGKVQNIDISAGYPYKGGELLEVLKNEANNEKMSGDNVYPTFASVARDEGFKDVAELFEMVAKVEKTHQKTLEELHDRLKSGTLYKCKTGVYTFKCDNCGTIVKEKSAPKECPLCKMAQGYYRIDFGMQ